MVLNYTKTVIKQIFKNIRLADIYRPKACVFFVFGKGATLLYSYFKRGRHVFKINTGVLFCIVF